MATILSVQIGGKTRRCDNTCHNAKRDKCGCVCGGAYHGAGGTAQTRLDEDVKAGRGPVGGLKTEHGDANVTLAQPLLLV